MNFTVFLLQKIKLIVDNSGFIAKFTIGIGICLILIYFWHIDYFPTDLSLGDGLLFFLITIKFLFVYVFFLGLHYALGSVFIFFIKLVRSFLKLILSFRTWSFIKLRSFFLTNIEFHSLTDTIGKSALKILVYFFIFIFIFAFYDGKPINLLVMVFLSILLNICICQFIDDWKSNKKLQDNGDVKTNIRLLMMMLYILIFPSSLYFFYAEKTKNIFINIALGSVREDEKNSLIYIKTGFKDFFPQSKHGEKKGEYIEIKGSEILLKGVGKNALIQYTTKINNKNGGEVKIKVKVEIPNEALLIVRRSQYKE